MLYPLFPATSIAHSALPDAPVLPDEARVQAPEGPWAT